MDDDDEDEDDGVQKVELKEGHITFDQVHPFFSTLFVSDSDLWQARRITLQSAWRSTAA